MDTSVIDDWWRLFISDNLLRAGLYAVVVITFIFFYFFGFYAAFIVCASYLLGFRLFHTLLTHIIEVKYVLSSVTTSYLNRCHNLQINDIITYKEPDHLDNSHSDKYPILFVSPEIDQALDKLLTRVLDEHVSNWYNTISSDVSFQHELRTSFKQVISIILHRALQVNITNVIINKLLPLYLAHVEDSTKLINGRQLSHLHVAVVNRHSEILYLQNVSNCLLSEVLQKSDQSCNIYTLLVREIFSRWVLLPLSDAICNPAVLNVLLLRYLNGNFLSIPSEEKITETSSIELLRNFVDRCKPKNKSHLHLDLSQILKDPSLLSAFMQFMKTKKALHILQFCLDVDDFNGRMLKPELSSDEMDTLYKDAWDIYSVYFSANSPHCIQFKTDFATVLRKVLSKDVSKLRTSSVLYAAYEYVYSLLEKQYCHEFHNSIQFFAWLYGRSGSPNSNRSDASTPTHGHSPIKGSFGRKTMMEISNKLNKIKDALKSNTVLEGQTFDVDCKSADLYTSAADFVDDVELSAAASNRERNLNNWKVSIPTIDSRIDAISNKPYTVFVIYVQNNDDVEDAWLVERRPVDFYSMDAKLIEFHGNLIDVHLPSKPRLFTENLCNDNKQVFENYLNKLLENPSLKKSQLLYSFLKSTEEFEEESNFGRLFKKSVAPIPPRKERGQNLEPFIQSFMLGNDNHNKTSKYDTRESNRTTVPHAPCNTVFGNNFDINVDICSFSQQIFLNNDNPTQMNNVPLMPSKCLIYLGMRIYSLSDNVVKLILAVHMLLESVFDVVIRQIVRKFVSGVITSTNILYLINLLHWSIFENKNKSNPEEIEAALINVLDDRKDSLLHPVFSSLHNIWKNPVINKQLFYQVMDVLLEELFPELIPTEANSIVK